jgi:competence protein ComEC
LLSNALILLVQPYVMFFGGAATLAGLLFEPLGRAIGWAAYLPLTWTIRVVEWTAGLPYASIPFELSDWGLVGVYALIGAITLVALMPPERRRALWEGMRSSVPVTAGLGGMTVLAFTAWLVVLQFPGDKLHVTFLDVGQGDAIFIESPGGAQILVDGGPAGSTVLAELGRQMPFWDRTLDLVVLTHPDADHLTGLVPVLERYGVRALMFRKPLGEDDLVNAWRAAVSVEGATLVQGEAGTRLELSDGLTLEVLHPGPAGEGGDESNTNNDSLVLRLTYEEVAFLLPGDIQADVEQALVRSGAYLRSSVLKVPHHGAKTSASQAFLEAVSPQVAVISVGADNRFGHPSEEVLERLDGTLVYRTDRNGTVAVASDGQRMWIEAER